MAKAKDKAVVSMREVEQQMQAFSSSAKARINQPTGNTIGIRNSKWTYKQEVIQGDLLVIALDFVHCNTWYDSAFDPDSPQPPACFAISDDGEEMEPHASAPNKQHDRCDGCPMNAWGTADRGRGKACKNTYRIACMEADADPADAEVAILTLPPTSLKHWERYVTGLDSKLSRPPFGVVTRFTFDDDADYPLIEMTCEDVIQDATQLQGIMSRIDGVRSELMQPFDVSGYEAPAPKRKAKAKAKPKAKAKAKAKSTRGGRSKFS